MADDEDISPELDAMFGKWYERKRADEDADQEPSRAKPRSTVERFLFGTEEAS